MEDDKAKDIPIHTDKLKEKVCEKKDVILTENRHDIIEIDSYVKSLIDY